MPTQIESEAAYLMNLLPEAEVEVEAVRSGKWSDPATWGGLNPQYKKVCIPAGIQVDFTGGTATITWLCNEGTFNATAGTLKLETFTNLGSFLCGTQARPATFSMVFRNLGDIDMTKDPKKLGKGFISMGNVSIYGKSKTAFVSVPSVLKGAVSYAIRPSGWAVGDILFFPGASRGQSERVKITGISNAGIRWDKPLLFNHIPDRSDFSVHIANLTRSVAFSSEGKLINQRGHFMIMHKAGQSVQYASFKDLGRTDKSKPIDDPMNINGFDGTSSPGGATNPRGRYSLHLHHTGPSVNLLNLPYLNILAPQMNLNPTIVAECVVDGFPGWGFVNHSSDVEFTNNVAVSGYGAAFVTEIGGECGAFIGNLAAEIDGATEPGQRNQNQDWGYRGDGFWFQGPGCDVRNNVVADCKDIAYAFYSEPLYEIGYKGKGRYLTANLPDEQKIIAGSDLSVNPVIMPMRSFDDNTAYSISGSVLDTYNLTQVQTFDVWSKIKRLKAWNIYRMLSIPYTSHLEFQNCVGFNKVQQSAAVFAIAHTILNINMKFRFIDCDFEGFFQGVEGRAESEFTRTRFHCAYAFLMDGTDPTMNLTITECNIGIPTLPYVGIRNHVFKGSNLASLDANWNKYRGIAKMDGMWLYSPEQAQNFVPFPTTVPVGVDPALIGKTNMQIFVEFNQAVGGYLAPADAIPLGGIHQCLTSGFPPILPL